MSGIKEMLKTALQFECTLRGEKVHFKHLCIENQVNAFEIIQFLNVNGVDKTKVVKCYVSYDQCPFGLNHFGMRMHAEGYLLRLIFVERPI
jgi:hypothetical protein